jgi:hypothetical protein
MFEYESVNSLAEVESVGKATGSAIGWGLPSLSHAHLPFLCRARNFESDLTFDSY